MSTSGGPAHIHSAGPAARCLRDRWPAWPTSGTGHRRRLGRALVMPANERAAGDTRANAFTMSTSRWTVHLRRRTCARSGCSQASADWPAGSARRSVGNQVSRSFAKRLVRVVDSATTVISSNIVVTDPAATRLDRTDANGFASRLVNLGVAKALIHCFGGVQYVFSGTALGQVFVSVTAHQPDHTNSNEALRQDLSKP